VKCLTLVDRALHLAAGLLLLALLITVMAGVVSRAFNHPFSWTEEASGFLMVWLVCFGWMIASRRSAHIRIRYFQDKLSASAWRWTEVALQAAVGVLGAVIAWNSVYLVIANSDVEAVSLPISTAWMYVPLFPAGLVTLGQALAEVWMQRSGRVPVHLRTTA
jgi:TRAP-type transport system small permease protein